MEATAPAAGRRTPSALFVALAALMFTVLLGAAPAQAADQCRPGAMLSPLPFSSFQGADGDQCNITGTAGSYDWQQIVADGGFGSGGGTALIDNDTATGLNVFTGGSKEEKPKDWGFNSDFPNNKTNILAAWGYPDAQPDHLFLYLAFAREDASGSVNYNFELNQNPPSETFTTSLGATAIKRRAGDILIAYDRTGNSSVVINLCRWVPANPAQAWLEGTWSTCTNLTASGLAQGETNLTFPITNFLQGGATLAAGQFGEAAIDLTSALNLGGPGQAPCADFGAFWVRSRQSGSITSDPSDFIPPSKVGVNNCGRVVIKKTTVGTATVPPTKFDFTTDVNAIAEGSPDTTPTAFELAGGDTETIVKVQPGTYTLAETDPSSKGYDLTGLTCTETGAVTNVPTTTSLATRTATLKVDSGEEVTCTYTNTRRGQIIVEKQTLPNGDPESFGFTTGTGPFALTDGQTKTIDVLPGTHTVAEDAESGWSLSNLTCDDADSTGSTATRTATYRVAAGETVKCTFTNTKAGRLVVEKQTLPNGDAASFGFTTTATGAGTFSLTDGATESRDVAPGTYTATENVKAGWELTALTCDDTNSGTDKTARKATFDISPGETVTCTFTNTKDGKLIVEKQTLPNGDAASFGFTTTATGAGTFSLTDGATESRDVKPGSYTATENVKSGWELTGLSCDDQNSTTDKPNRKATFDISPGETVTCTFTNTKDGKLIVEKQTLPNGDAASFGFTTTATGAGTFSLTDGGTESRDVKPGSYTATEDLKAGWELTALSCDDTNSTTDKPNRKATFDISPGETVTCTFTNMKDGKLIVEKQTLPNGDAASFGFTTDATGAGTFSLTDGATEQRDVKPGSYTATENVKSGWELTGLSCSDQNSTTDKPNRKATFDISPGETVTCTFTNMKDGKLIVEKQTLPNGDAASFGFTTTATGAGTFSLTDGATEQRDVKPGSYTATENVKAGWELTALTCDDTNSGTDKTARKATFDISPGETVTCTFTNTKDGKLIVEKQTLPNGDAASFGFTTTATGAGTFSLTDGGTEERDVKPGSYTATENVKSGWELTGLSCSDQNSTTDKPNRKATFDISPGETVTCTFTNTKDGKLIVEKQTLPNGDAASFGFTTTATGAGTFSLTDGGTEERDVKPGSYTATENVKSGWELTGLSCSDQNSTTDKPNRKATFDISPGETVTCTFTNMKDGKLIVEKQTLPNGDAASFGFTTTATGAGTFSLTDGATEQRDVKPGSYTATENVKAGWELTALTCDDTNSGTDKTARKATFDISPGETVTCTFTNTKDGRLVVEKQTLPNGDAASFGFTTDATGAGTFSLTDGGTEERDVKPGSYTATENVKSGWELTGLSCDDTNSTTDKPNRKATFDISPGETVTCTFTNTKDGKLIVEKQTLPNGDAASFGFTTTATGAGTFSLTDGATEERDVKPGSYTATENVKSGWELTGLSCSDQNSTTDKPNRKATFDISPGETVTCTFTNTKDGKLIVEKQTLPNGDAASFGFTTDATGAGTFSLTDGGTEQRDVKPGSYTATENVKSGWELTGLSCSDQNSTTDKPNRKATFDISPGETVTCTFTNTKDGRLVVEKQTLPNGDAASFGFTTTATGAGTFSLTDGGTESRDVKPGSYTATEDLKAGWDLTGLSCDDQNSTTDKPNRKATFDISPGETVTCTFTNTKDARLIVEKQTLPNGDAASFGFTTTATGNGTFSLSDNGTESRDVKPGTYTATEDIKSGWELTGLVCDDTDSTTDKVTRKATFVIAPGEHVTCTFTNTKEGKLIVEKQTLPDGDPASFGFTTTATGAGTFSLTDGATESRDVKPGSYTATENAAAGYTLDALSCSDQNSTTDKPNRKATFDISPGETVTCTFTNAKDGKLIVEKQTLPDGDAASFGFTTTATGNNTFALTDGGTESRDVVPGSYIATENVKAGWELTGLSCSDQNSTTDKPNRKATFDISPGETVTCTFTNTKDGKLIVEKQTLPDGDAASFGFTTTATGNGTFSLTDGGKEERDVAPGTYTVTENVKAGWELTGLSCSDQNSTTDKPNRKATFDISPGETVTCTFTNTKDGKLIVEKQTLPDGDPTQFDFATSASGSPSFKLSDGQTEVRDVKPGTYTASEATASGFRLDQVACDDADSTGDKASRTATYRIAPGETVKCSFLNRTISANAVVVKAGNEWAYHGDTLTFTFTVNNSGQSPLTNVTVSDDRCAPVTLKAKRDINGNPDTTPDVLDLTDTWIYECTMAAPAHTAGEANPIVNTVTVGALDEFQRPVSDTDQHSTLLIHPAIAIDKTGPATAQAGQAVQYTLVVTNPGDVPFLAPNVNVSDALCQAPPMLSTTNGDATPGQLDPGDTWTYTCTVQTLVGQTVVDNVGVVTGTDSYGGQEVTDEDPATTQLTQPPVVPPPPVTITPSGTPVPRPVALAVPVATARLSGPKRCVSGPFETKVTGRNIAKVLFLLDGKKLKTVMNTGNRTVFKARITPSGKSSKAHRVVAKVTFKAATRTPTRTLRFIYLGCAKVAPQFTG